MKKTLIVILALGISASILNNLPFILMPLYQQKSPEQIQFYPDNSSWTPLPVRGANSLNYDLALFASLGNKLQQHGLKLLFSDVYLYEHKDTPYIEGAIPYDILALTAKFFSGNIDIAWQVVSYLFSFLCFVSIFLLARVLGLPVSISVSLPFALMFLADPESLINADGLNPIKDFNRFPKISFSFLLLSAFLIITYKLLFTKKSKWVLPLTLVLSLCFYDYVYYWTTLTGATILILCYSLIKNRFNRDSAHLAVVLILSILTGIPLIRNIVLFLANPNYPFLKESKDQVVHGFSLPSSFFFGLIFLIGIWFLKKKRGDESRVATLAPFTAVFISCYFLMHAWFFNLPQMTQYHYATTIFRPLFLILGAVLFYEIILLVEIKFQLSTKQMSALTMSASVFTVFIFAQYAFVNNLRYSQKNFPLFVYNNNLITALNVLTKQAHPQDVILTVSAEANFLSAMKTPLYQFIPGFHLSMAGFEERWKRILIGCEIFGVSKERLLDFLDDENINYRYWGQEQINQKGIPNVSLFERAFFLAQPFHNYYYFHELNTNENNLHSGLTLEEYRSHKNLGSYIPLSHRKHALKMYDVIQRQSAQAVLHAYKLNYILSYRQDDAIGQQISAKYLPFLSEVFKNKDVTIYKVETSSYAKK